MPKIDNEIRNAIEMAVNKYGSQRAFARKVGISIANLSRYLKGDVKKMNLSTWKLLLNEIIDFLPDGFSFECQNNNTTESLTIHKTIQSNIEQRRNEKLYEYFGDELPERKKVEEVLIAKIKALPHDKSLKLLLLLLDFDNIIEQLPLSNRREDL